MLQTFRATQIRHSGEIVCINMKGVCGFPVSHINYALLRRIAALRIRTCDLLYQPSSVVRLSVGLSVSHTSKPCKNG